MSKPPPIPLYPKRYDSDNTLFLVYNTSESILSKDNSAWSEEIDIEPIFSHEVWADSGFANLDGELFYYNSVERSDFNGVQLATKFKGCVRNLGGSSPKFNKKGSKVRGFVVAEHHNQIADAIINIEKFVGSNFTEEQDTLDWRIRNLASIPVVFDDHNCPDVNFTFNVIDYNNVTGIVARYLIQINNASLDTTFLLDFGDGATNNNLLEGTHTYAINGNIDPVLTVSNSLCSVTLTPTERENNIDPRPTEIPTLEIPVPPPPEIPVISITPVVIPANKYNIPPIVFPCLDISPIGGINIPSKIEIVPPVNIPPVITITPINIPTRITITPVNIPTLITITPITVNIPTYINITPVNIPSRITITPVSIPTLITITPVSIPTLITITPVSIPTLINFGPHGIPPVINFGPVYIPTFIEFGNVNIPTYIQIDSPAFNIPTYIQIDSPNINVNIPTKIYFDDNVPSVIVDWNNSNIPTITVIVTVECGTSGGSYPPTGAKTQSQSDDYMELDVGGLGIPSIINIAPPIFPKVQFESVNIPTFIQLGKIEGISEIKISAPDVNIPSQIKIINESFLPSSITVESKVPEIIRIQNNLPEFIPIKLPEDFPKEIKLNASDIPREIQVVGVPSVIQLQGYIPSIIQLVMPEKPEVEMVYRGAPIDVKVELDLTKLSGDGDKTNCVSIVPCK